MRDIQVDENGDLRCVACGGKHFTEKRTARSKVVGVGAGVATLGVAGAVAPLATRKKLQCKICGTYNKQGNAQPFKPRTANAAAGVPAPRANAPEKKELSDGEMLISAVMLCAFALIGLVWAISSGSIGWSIACGILLALFTAMLVASIYDSSSSSPKTPKPRSAAGPQRRTNDPAFQIKKKRP